MYYLWYVTMVIVPIPSIPAWAHYSANIERYAGSPSDCKKPARSPGEEVGLFATVTVPQDQKIQKILGGVAPSVNLSVMH